MQHFSGNRKIEFNDNEVVMAKDYASGKWRKAKIMHKLGSVVYAVQTDDNREWKRHADQLRPCNLPLVTSVNNSDTIVSSDLASNVIDTALTTNNDIEPQCGEETLSTGEQKTNVNSDIREFSVSNTSCRSADTNPEIHNQPAESVVTVHGEGIAWLGTGSVLE